MLNQESSHSIPCVLQVMLDGRNPDCMERVLLDRLVPADTLQNYKDWEYKCSIGPKVCV